MTMQNEERIFSLIPARKVLIDVEIEGVGSMKIEGSGFEPISALVGQVDMMLSENAEIVRFSFDEKPPYTIISFDKRKGLIKVRRKSA